MDQSIGFIDETVRFTRLNKKTKFCSNETKETDNSFFFQFNNLRGQILCTCILNVEDTEQSAFSSGSREVPSNDHFRHFLGFCVRLIEITYCIKGI